MFRVTGRRSHVLAAILALVGGSLLSEDCNQNGVDDALDLENGSPDCNESGILDACEIGKFFGPALEIPTAVGPWDMEAADFDSDGDMDIGLTAAHRAWIFPNDGSGALGAPLELLLAVHPGTETYPKGLTFSDLDSDGDPDLAVVKDVYSDNLVLFFNDGQGGFSPPSLLTVPDRGASAVSSGDLDGDSDQDLLVTTSTGLHLLLNQGSGTFGPPTPLYASANLSRGAIADFDGDGANDIAFAGGQFFGIVVMENSLVAGFDPPLVHDVRGIPIDLLAADVNGDGAVDLISGRSQGNFVSIVWNAGGGSFVRRLDLDLQSGVVAVALADLDDDGDMDLLAIDQGWVLHAFTQSPGETFAPLEKVVLPGQIFSDLIATDVDGDGDPDPIALSLHDNWMLRIPNVAGAISTFDCNSNAVLDGCELRSGAADCDTNGVPDACQLDGGDCNRNEVPDACDLKSGTSSDCNHNGLPDECDVLDAPTLDCNRNGLPDSCEFSSRDCDEDGEPDECEIARSPELDCDGDGTLDVCEWDPVFKFDAARALRTGSASQDIQFGDLNADDRMDFIAGNDADSVSVALGEGGGRFRMTSERAGLAPLRVAISDWNGDSILDFAAANLASHNVSIHVGNGGGTFLAAKFHRVQPEPTDLLAADLDGDFDPDLVVLSAPRGSDLEEQNTGTLSVLLNDLEGGFIAGESFVVPPCGFYLTSGDLDSDGDVDLVLTRGALEGSVEGLALIPGRGDGTFDPAVEIPLPGRSLAVLARDLDGDGTTDLAAALAPSGLAILKQASGSGLVIDRSYEAPLATALEAEDLDGDGKLDLIASDVYTNTVHVLDQGDEGAFLEPRQFFVYSPVSTRAGDVDEDGHPDLVCAHAGAPPISGHYVSILHNDGEGNFAPPAFHVGREPTLLLCADLDGDTRTDVVAADEASSSLSVFYGDGEGGFSSIRRLSTAAGSGRLSSGDVDGDGLPDLAVASERLRTISILLHESGREFSLHTTVAAQGNTFALALADATFDGLLDLIAGYADPFDHGTLCFYRGMGNGDFELPVVQSLENRISSGSITDIDGDGRLDLLAAGRLEQATDLPGLIVCLGSGAGGFLPPVGTITGSLSSPEPGDLDGDGTQELLVASSSTLVIFEYQGEGRYDRGGTISVPDGGHGVRIADIDLDDKPDVIVRGREALSVLFGDGQGGFGKLLEFPSKSANRDFAVASLRAGRYPDILTLDINSLVIWRNATAPLEGKDCDGNGVLDFCELEGNDVNENGVPDVCDILHGILRDSDGDGEPDGPQNLARFHRADVDADGTLTLADPISLLMHLFSTGTIPPCLDAADSNDDNLVNITDPIHSLVYMFSGGPGPPPPGPPPRPCGADPDPPEEQLGCASYAPCA